MPGRLSNYEFRATIGQGATGNVFLAAHYELERYVAIKQLAPVLASEPSFIERFRGEAQLLASLEHANIVKVYDYIEEEPGVFLIMEFVEGASLRAVVARSGFLTPEQALGVLKGALGGLGYAHSRGLIHRDVKPENVIADLEGVSKLVDFGQAMISPGPGAAGGYPAGTPAYMSPEVITGAAVTAKSDIYSAAAMLFEFLTGRVPYVADDPLAMMRKHVTAPVPNPCDLNQALPARIGQMVMKGMAKDPDDRYPTVDLFLGELAAAAIEAYGPDWEKRSSIQRDVSAVAVTLAGLLGAGESALAGAGGAGEAAVEAAAGVPKWAIAVGMAIVLIGGGIAGAFASGLLGGGSQVAVTVPPSPTPSATPAPSPSPSPAPSPSPTAAPSPSPSLAPSPSAAPTPPGPSSVGFTATGLWYQDCSTQDGSCGPQKDGSAAADPTTALSPLCQSPNSYLHLFATYRWTYRTAAGGPIAPTITWLVTDSLGQTTTVDAPPYPPAAPPSGAIPQPPGGAVPATQVSIAPSPQTYHVTFKLAWSDGSGAHSATWQSSFFYNGCGKP